MLSLESNKEKEETHRSARNTFRLRLFCESFLVLHNLNNENKRKTTEIFNIKIYYITETLTKNGNFKKINYKNNLNLFIHAGIKYKKKYNHFCNFSAFNNSNSGMTYLNNNQN